MNEARNSLNDLKTINLSENEQKENDLFQYKVGNKIFLVMFIKTMRGRKVEVFDPKQGQLLTMSLRKIKELRKVGTVL